MSSARVVLDRDADVCKEVQAELLPVFVCWSPEWNGGCFSPSVNVRFGRCGLSIMESCLVQVVESRLI